MKNFKYSVVLIGLLSLFDYSQSRAVNISSTSWTLPHMGFNVFYRYFRDKISWFEADAVCQFHHANLVSVDNMEQFDTSREFLRELNVSDSVWIGLMRPSNMDRFTWPNAKPFSATTDLWAEILPVIDAPLCTVTDPIRDFRWHALRCGGPETASFLCELEVPDWALDCVSKNDENMDVQYLPDSGEIVLLNKCDDIVKRVTCQEKMDRQKMFDELKCDEEDNDDISSTSETVTEMNHSPVMLKTPIKMLDDIFEIDDNINNDNSMAEVNSNRLDIPEKTLSNKKRSREFGFEEEMMMGDQPSQDVQTTSTPNLSSEDATSTILTSDSSIPIEELEKNETDVSLTPEASNAPSTAIETTTMVTEPVTKHISAGHPIHLSQMIPKDPPLLFDQLNTTNVPRKELRANDDHFIPPMLLVKARFVPTKPQTEGTTLEMEPIDPAKDLTTESSNNLTSVDSQSTVDVSDETTIPTPNHTTSNVQISEEPISQNAIDSSSTAMESVTLLTEKPILLNKRNDGKLVVKKPVTPIITTSNIVKVTPTVNKHYVSTQPSIATKSLEYTTSDLTNEIPENEIIDTTQIKKNLTKNDFKISMKYKPDVISKTTTATTQDFSVSSITTTATEPKTTTEKHQQSTETLPSTSETSENSAQHINNFSNMDYVAYKPNRHRILTKSEYYNHGSYIKKILG